MGFLDSYKNLGDRVKKRFDGWLQYALQMWFTFGIQMVNRAIYKS